jgi:hypothetical protein
MFSSKPYYFIIEIFTVHRFKPSIMQIKYGHVHRCLSVEKSSDKWEATNRRDCRTLAHISAFIRSYVCSWIIRQNYFLSDIREVRGSSHKSNNPDLV